MNKEQLGAFIAERRREEQMPQKDLAERLHVTDKAVSKWERGLSYPDVTLLEPLAEALGLGVEELMACRRQESEKGEEPVNTLLDISRENLRRERHRARSRLIGVAVLALATALAVWYTSVFVSERREDTIFLKETTEDGDYLYVELKNKGHLLKLKCGPEVDFHSIAPEDGSGGRPQYRLDCRWNRRTHPGTVSRCEPTGNVSIGGLADAVFGPDEAQVFGIRQVLYAPENYYRNPFGEGFLCDYRFWRTDEEVREGFLQVVEDGRGHFTGGMEDPILLVEDCVSAAVWDWDGDLRNEVVVRTRWPEKPYTVYDLVDGRITGTWPDTVPEEVRERLVCIWER